MLYVGWDVHCKQITTILYPPLPRVGATVFCPMGAPPPKRMMPEGRMEISAFVSFLVLTETLSWMLALRA